MQRAFTFLSLILMSPFTWADCRASNNRDALKILTECNTRIQQAQAYRTDCGGKGQKACRLDQINFEGAQAKPGGPSASTNVRTQDQVRFTSTEKTEPLCGNGVAYGGESTCVRLDAGNATVKANVGGGAAIQAGGGYEKGKGAFGRAGVTVKLNPGSK